MKRRRSYWGEDALPLVLYVFAMVGAWERNYASSGIMLGTIGIILLWRVLDILREQRDDRRRREHFAVQHFAVRDERQEKR